MHPILYVETNFVLGVAKGQNVLAGRFLEDGFPGIEVVIPGVCFMEAFSVLKNERKRRRKFQEELRSESREAKRDRTSAHAPALAVHLEQAIIESGELLNVIASRLHDAIDKLTTDATLLPLEFDVIHDSLTATHIDDPTDNLILCSLLWHARRHRAEPKAFFSANSQDFADQAVKDTLLAADVLYFPGLEKALEWLKSQPTAPTEPA